MDSEVSVDLITKNDLQPGDRSPTGKELSEQLGIGNTSPRDGIRQLEAIGLLSSQLDGGVFVKEATIESIFRQIVSALTDRN